MKQTKLGREVVKEQTTKRNCLFLDSKISTEWWWNDSLESICFGMRKDNDQKPLHNSLTTEDNSFI